MIFKILHGERFFHMHAIALLSLVISVVVSELVFLSNIFLEIFYSLTHQSEEILKSWRMGSSFVWHESKYHSKLHYNAELGKVDVRFLDISRQLKIHFFYWKFSALTLG